MIGTRPASVRAVVVAVSLFAVTACGTPDVAAPTPTRTAEPVVAAPATSIPPTAVLPTKASLGQRYLLIVDPYNKALSAALPIFRTSTSLPELTTAADKVADANWVSLSHLRAMKDSITPPSNGYSVADGTFYQELYSALDAMIEDTVVTQAQYAALRDVNTLNGFDTAYAALDYDGITPRRVRSLLNLPDVPSL